MLRLSQRLFIHTTSYSTNLGALCSLGAVGLVSCFMSCLVPNPGAGFTICCGGWAAICGGGAVPADVFLLAMPAQEKGFTGSSTGKQNEHRMLIKMFWNKKHKSLSELHFVLPKTGNLLWHHVLLQLIHFKHHSPKLLTNMLSHFEQFEIMITVW